MRQVGFNATKIQLSFNSTSKVDPSAVKNKVPCIDFTISKTKKLKNILKINQLILTFECLN